MTHEEWLALRRTGLGGSDIAPICKWHPRDGPLHVWMEKFGMYQREPEDKPEYLHIGQLMEPVVTQLFEERTGMKLAPCGWLRHPDIPWIVGTPDRQVIGRSDMGVELKIALPWMAKRWGPDDSDIYPAEYFLQCAWYMKLTGAREWWLAVLIGGYDFRVYHLTRDEECLELVHNTSSPMRAGNTRQSSRIADMIFTMRSWWRSSRNISRGSPVSFPRLEENMMNFRFVGAVAALHLRLIEQGFRDTLKQEVRVYYRPHKQHYVVASKVAIGEQPAWWYKQYICFTLPRGGWGNGNIAILQP